VLYNFCSLQYCADGYEASAPLTSDGAGNLYGTTGSGGGLACWNSPYACGIAFELSPNGSGGWNETVLHSFCSTDIPPNCADGDAPEYGPLILDGSGNLYGSAAFGGAYGYGIVFELSPSGGAWTEKILYSFTGGANGEFPGEGVIVDPAGNLYGTTFGNGSGTQTGGTVFKLSPSDGGWMEQTIYTLNNNNCHNGAGVSGLTMDATGNIFGVTCAMVYELAPNGSGGWNPTVLHTFALSHFALAPGNPVFDKTGNLYFTSGNLGHYGNGAVYRLSLDKKGTWIEKILYSFPGGTGGAYPGSIFLDAAGNIYGSTGGGGTRNAGTIFELVAPVGKGNYVEKILWNFDYTGGAGPNDVIRDSAGNFYGTTYSGGSNNLGVAFKVTP
jgi:uncharacterized repeat protein (TIGR03803 family)